MCPGLGFSVVRDTPQGPMPAPVGLSCGGIDDHPLIREADLVNRQVEVDRQEAAGPHQEVVDKDGLDTTNRPIAPTHHPPADSRLAHCPTLADAICRAAGTASNRTGSRPKGSPSRCTGALPSISRLEIVKKDTFGFRTCAPR